MYKFFHNIFEKKHEERNDDWADYEKRNYKDLDSEDLNQFKIGITMPILLVIILLFIIISVLDSFMFLKDL